ncbi:MAG: hypothetical protein J6K72_08410 [Clostridia bacterium]|nr:hypothetical protein [Clostridia bacterium]
MNRLKGIPIYEVTKPGAVSGKRKKRKNNDEEIPKIEKLPTHELVRMYLCERKKSRCVKYGSCECLDKCRYGQEYIKRQMEKNHGK